MTLGVVVHLEEPFQLYQEFSPSELPWLHDHPLFPVDFLGEERHLQVALHEWIIKIQLALQ